MKWGGDYKNNIIVYPCGDVGIQIINIMKSIYNLDPALIIDNRKCKYSRRIHNISYLGAIDTNDCVLILASTNPDIYEELFMSASVYFPIKKIIELECMFNISHTYPQYVTKIGKYSYGPICINHKLIESIGSFCSFAAGVDVVENHEIRYVTTHPIIYAGKNINEFEFSFDSFSNDQWYFAGIDPPSDKIKKQRRSIIGNDVWLGKNVTVTNGANIGNGVIAAAGAVITKDIPDYAIVAGVPARVIRYRYTPMQIESLNRIAWWNWTEEEIRERYHDFYLPIDDFINKYL